MEKSKLNRKEKMPQENRGLTNETNSDMEWFTQFSDMPGIFDFYTANELEEMKTRMMLDLKKKINKID